MKTSLHTVSGCTSALADSQHACAGCRLTNIGNSSISIDDITLDYWLNGPAESTASVDQFNLVCSDTTLGEFALLPYSACMQSWDYCIA